MMAMHSFSLALDGYEATVEDADALYDVCDGVLLRSTGGTAFVDFDCEAASLEAAVDGATGIEQALPHARVTRVEVDRSDLHTTPAA
jgi:hypothetical protein